MVPFFLPLGHKETGKELEFKPWILKKIEDSRIPFDRQLSFSGVNSALPAQAIP